MERTEWPTRGHLAELRDQGITAISLTALRCICALALLLGLLLSAAAARRFLALWRESLTAGRGVAFGGIRELAEETARLLIIPLVSSFVLVAVAGLLQTRFMFRFDRLAMEGRKFNGLAFFRLGSLAGRFLSSLVVLGLCCAAAAVWFRYLIPIVLSAPAVTPERAVDFAVLLGRAAAVWIVPGLAALAVITWVGNWIYFMHTHRMTRREVEAEARE